MNRASSQCRLAQAIVGGLLAVLNQHALAAADSGLYETSGQAPHQRPAPQDCMNTMQTVPSVLITQDGALTLGRVVDTSGKPHWLGANLDAWQPHMRNVLLGSDKADIDSRTSPCYLGNGDIDADYFKNDGGNASELLNEFDNVQVENKNLSDDDEHTLAEFMRRKQTIEQIANDSLPSIAPAGLRVESGQARFQDVIDGLEGHGVAEKAGDMVYGKSESGFRARIPPGKSGHGDDETGGPGGGSVPEVPEPAGYLALLAGLGALGVLARRRRASSGPAQRR